jgi:hypothetical protein
MFGSKGKIDISIQKFNYAPGDTISGNVALTLKKPVQAREVSISLIGEQWVTTYSGTRIGVFDSTRTPGGGMMGMGRPRMTGGGGLGMEKSTEKQRERIYEFKLPLDSEREYSEGREYRFEIKIPADILGMGPQMTGAGSSSPIKWYLLAKLDIPGGSDISKKVDVTIG